LLLAAPLLLRAKFDFFAPDDTSVSDFALSGVKLGGCATRLNGRITAVTTTGDARAGLLPLRHDGQNTSPFQKWREMSSPFRKNIYLSEIRKPCFN
jgi:hypothetical protein